MPSARKILAAYTLLVLYLCLFPWTLREGAAGPWFHPYWPQSRSAIADFLLNILFFVPVGISATLSFRGRYAWGAFVGIGLSAAVEFLQGWLPIRVSSLTDLFSNSLGTLLGCAAAPLLSRVGNRGDKWWGVRLQLPALVLLAGFLGSQWFPFIPRYRLYHLKHALSCLLEPGDPFAGLLALAFFAAAGFLLQSATVPSPGWPPRLLFLGILLVVRPLVTASPFSGGEWAGAVAGGIAGTILRRELLARLLFVAFPVVLALDQLRPFTFVLEPKAFRWMPFAALFDIAPSAAVQYFTKKLFFYGSTIHFLSRWPLSPLHAAGCVLLLLAGTESLQRFLPGRTPETTDVVLGGVAALLLWLARRASATPENTRHGPGSGPSVATPGPDDRGKRLSQSTRSQAPRPTAW